MIPPSPRSNDLLNPKQIEMLRESISAREGEVKLVEESIEKEKITRSTHSAAIAHLEPTILRAKEALLAHQKLLSNSKEMKREFERAYAVPGPDWVNKSEARDLCQTATAAIDSQIISCSAKLTKDIKQSEEYILGLQAAIHKLEIEVSSRQFMQAMSAQYISDTEKHIASLQENIKILKSRLNHVKNVPAEVWAKIFSLRVRADLTESMDSRGSTRTLDTAMKLSQVCRFWRNIVCSVRSLWDYIPVYAARNWPEGTLEYLKYSGSLASAIPVLLCHLARSPGGWHGTTTVEDDGVFEAYSTQVLVNEDEYYWPSLSLIPFRRPKLLGLQFESSQGQEALNHLLDAFSGYTSLEILFKGDYPQTVPSPVNIREELTYLKLDFTTATSFDITQYLSQNLQELHIKHNGPNALLSNPTPLQLPRLEVLGLTPIDTSFTELSELPNLKKLVLYGPKRLAVPFPSLAPIADTTPFKKLVELELRDWSLYKKPDMSTWSIMTPLSDVVEKMRSVESLRCVDSGVEGSQLVEWVTALKEPTNIIVSRLENILIDCCTGITRDQCDALSQMVQKFEIYV